VRTSADGARSFLRGFRVLMANLAMPVAAAIMIGCALDWHELLTGTCAFSLVFLMHFLCQWFDMPRITVLDERRFRAVLSVLFVSAVAYMLTHAQDACFVVDFEIGDLGPEGEGPAAPIRAFSWMLAVFPAAPYVVQSAGEFLFER